MTVAPRARIVCPRYEPEVGAVLLALKAIGAEITGQITSALEKSALDFPECRFS
jgi:hypothetical protein